MTIPDCSLPYCTITGTFVAVDADSADADSFPDVQPLNGTITLTPTTNAGRVDDAFAQILPVTVRVLGGQIVDEQDIPGARILATDANIGVADWAWRASFKFDGLSLDPLTFKAPRGTTVNLTSGLVPIKSQPYQIVEGASIVDSESDTGAGLIRFKLSDGTYTRWVPGVGEKGEKGDPGVKGDRGDDGVAATISMGSVTAGANADMWMTGTPQARELHAVLPRGLRGDQGERGERGTQGERGPAGQSVTRTAPGAFSITGGGVPAWDDITGKPLSYPSTVADVSGIVVDTSVGVRVSIGGHLVHASTGRRNVTSLFSAGLDPENIGSIYMSRQDGRAIVEFAGVKLAAGTGTIIWPSVLPSGFSPIRSGAYTAVTRGNSFTALQVFGVNGSAMYWLSELSPASSVSSTTTRPSATITGQIEYSASGWPTTLPGTPA